MKTYKVKVNGKSYIVELESVEETSQTIAKKETKKEEKVKSETTAKTASISEILKNFFIMNYPFLLCKIILSLFMNIVNPATSLIFFSSHSIM